MSDPSTTVPIDPRIADGFRRRDALTFVLRGVLIALMVLAIGGVTLALRASATEPARTTYTASATQLVITYGAGADSIDVNVRYPDGTTTNYHPNRSAAVGEVLTLPLTGLPAWVQVHTTNCHIGEPGSPGYGTDCRLIEEDPCPTATTPAGPEPSPSSPPSETPVTPTEPEPTETGQPTPQPSTTPSTEPSTPTPDPTDTSTSSPSPTTEPSPGPSDEPSTTPSETPGSTDPTPTSPGPDGSTTTPTTQPDPPFDGTNGDPAGWPENYNEGDDEPTYTSDVSAVDDSDAATASPRALAATGTSPVVMGLTAVVLLILGSYLALFGRRPRR